jgi:hypothetical protein
MHKRLPLRAVALGNNGTYVVLFENGKRSCSSGLPDSLQKWLKEADSNNEDIADVALGRNQGSDTYDRSASLADVAFLRLDTKQVAGTTRLSVGSEASLKDDWWESKNDKRVVKVCFAPSNGWFLRRQGGIMQATYKGLPASLSCTIGDNNYQRWKDEGSIKTLSVGHNGEWFVLWGSGGYTWNGVHLTLWELLRPKSGSTLRNRTGWVEWVELGPNGTFVAQFEKYTAWYGNQHLTEALLSCM